MPKNYRMLLIEKYPEYNTVSGGELVRNVLRLRSADVLLTERLEEIVKEWEEKQEGEAA
jgi:hypothetical protein